MPSDDITLPERGPVLHLELDAPEVTLAHLVSAAEEFSDLVREVAREFTSQVNAVRWVISGIRQGSLVLDVRPEPAIEEVAFSAMPDLVQTIATGLSIIEERAERPPHFSDRALDKARALADLTSEDLPAIRLRDGRRRTRLSKRLVANVEEIIGPAQKSHGTVEGRLEAMTIHGRPSFSVYEAQSGRRVTCYFGERVPLEILRTAFGRRVGARGLIRSRPDGVKVSIEVGELRIFPEETELPTPDEVRGITKEDAA